MPPTNLSTALRQTSTGFLLGWLFYIPMYLLGIPAEVVVTVGSLNLIYQFWVHTEHIPKLGWYEWFFVTPSNHRVHHAQNDRYLDRNYGGLFIIWDRMFGTFEPERAPVVYGLRKNVDTYNPVTITLMDWRALFAKMRSADSLADALCYFFAPPGWEPHTDKVSVTSR